MMNSNNMSVYMVYITSNTENCKCTEIKNFNFILEP